MNKISVNPVIPAPSVPYISTKRPFSNENLQRSRDDMDIKNKRAYNVVQDNAATNIQRQARGIIGRNKVATEISESLQRSSGYKK